MGILDHPIEAEARLRQKNQLTMPEPIVRALDAAPDDILVFEADPAEPGVAHVRLLPRDFAGSLTGVFGTSEETLQFIRGERAAWGE
jgi:bifunctional DNA-binding transcriptional regulator/antitoxin component of YhaV-PrlF toxin-antitoxin module